MNGTTFNGNDAPIPRFSFQKCWNRAVEKAEAEAALMYPPHQEAARAEVARSLTVTYYRQMSMERCDD